MARISIKEPSKRTILVVDDQQEVLLSTKSLLEREGHRVLVAQSAAVALEMFKEEEVHLLLVDYLMPRMSGEELVREIRAFDPYVQIVLQTGHCGERPPRTLLRELDIQGYHDKTEGSERLLLWVQVALRAHASIHGLRERERRQSELIANVSHELRNPLNVIGGYAELLRDGSLGDMPTRTHRPIRTLSGTTKMLSELVGNFLSYAKLEAGAMTLERCRIDAQEIVADLADFAAFLIGDKAVRFRVEPEHVAGEVVVDWPKVRSILRNLVANAVKFTPDGTVTLSVSLGRGTIFFAVADTGIGIPAHHHESIFEPFRQLDGSLTRAHGGIGLGLALAHRLARMHGGEIHVSSEPGVGSTFTLTLPSAHQDVHSQPGADNTRPAVVASTAETERRAA